MNIQRIKKGDQTLYFYGNEKLLNEPIIAVIGKRNAPIEALNSAFTIGQQLAQEGFVVLNGLAVGCDKRAIEGALWENGKTIAVLPCGIDKIYPASCKDISIEIIRKGGLIVSQYPPGVGIEKYRFVERDKLEAQLSNKIISVYADEEGGTMHTLKFAHHLGRTIGCILDSTGNDYACRRMGACKIASADELTRFAATSFTQMNIFDFIGTKS